MPQAPKADWGAITPVHRPSPTAGDLRKQRRGRPRQGQALHAWTWSAMSAGWGNPGGGLQPCAVFRQRFLPTSETLPHHVVRYIRTRCESMPSWDRPQVADHSVKLRKDFLVGKGFIVHWVAFEARELLHLRPPAVGKQATNPILADPGRLYERSLRECAAGACSSGLGRLDYGLSREFVHGETFALADARWGNPRSSRNSRMYSSTSTPSQSPFPARTAKTT